MANANPTDITSSSTSAVPRGVWITMGVLALAVAAMGGALVTRWSSTPSEGTPQVAASAASLPASAAASAGAMAQAPDDGPRPPQAQPRAPVQQPARKQQPQHTASPAPQPGAMPAQAVAPRPICANCGTVQAVNQVQVKGEGSGLGAVAGGVVGGVVGNQMGGGNGKTAMTVLGAIGGGLAGNEIEKRTKATTVFDVQVRMEDGTVRTVRSSQALGVGSRVVVDANGVHPAQ